MVDFFKHKEVIHLELESQNFDIAVLTGTEEIVIQQGDNQIRLPVYVGGLLANLLKKG